MADFQKNIWAPWRMEYIEGLSNGDAGCFLCRARADADHDEANLVLWRGQRTLVLLNRFPYTGGHILVAPVDHVAEPEDLPDDVLHEMMRRACDAKRVLAKAFDAQGFNMGINLGRCAGAGLPDHVHMHVVPRWSGDVNFMAVLGDVKVIPLALAATRRRFCETAEAMGLPRG